MRIAGMVAVVVAGIALSGFAAPAGDETRTGCVMQTEAGWFTFCEPNSCSEIKGAGVNPKLAGHKVTVSGTLQAETATAPKTFMVTKVISVGAACNETCSPRPAGHRGLGSHDKPGSEGGTPGAVAPKPPPGVPPPL
jgi:hypothetical protein